MLQRQPIAIAMAAMNTECHQGAVVVCTSIGEVLSCHSICHTARNQSWTWEWPGNEANDSKWCNNWIGHPDAQSVHTS